MGRFTIAAKHHMNIAELYESEAMDIEKAIEHYEKVCVSVADLSHQYKKSLY